MNSIAILNQQTQIGKLNLSEYIPVSGSHVRAENYFIVYELQMNHSVIPGLFLNHYVLDDTDMFICRIHLHRDDNGDNGGGTLDRTEIVRINLTSLSVTVFAQLSCGYIYPRYIENNKLIYTKQHPGNSAVIQYERDL